MAPLHLHKWNGRLARRRSVRKSPPTGETPVLLNSLLNSLLKSRIAPGLGLGCFGRRSAVLLLAAMAGGWIAVGPGGLPRAAVLALAAEVDVRTPTGDSGSQPAAEDVLELVSGSVVRGKIVARDEKQITIRTTISGRSFTRKYPLERVRAVTSGGGREVLQGSAEGGPPEGGPPARDARTGAPAAANRSRAEIDALIDKQGRTPPAWWDSVPLSYPKTLDLSWPEPAPAPWNAQKNVGQYVWDVINPNPGKWREGVRLMHHLLVLHKDDPDKAYRAMELLAHMYHDLLQDYPRAAFWWRKLLAAQGGDSPDGIKLAECYWKLGSKKMATDLLSQLSAYYATIKLLADLGETRAALRLAESAARGGEPDLAYLYAGDACRLQGDYAQAIQYFEKVLKVAAAGQAAQRIQRNQTRARANIEAIRIVDTLDLGRVPDGTYRSSSPAYNGELHVKVIVRGGRIESVEVTGHQEKQFYSALTDTPRQIVEKQGVRGVDAVSRATITSEAILNATAKALASPRN